MASLHPASGTPAVGPSTGFNHFSPNPFLKSDAVPAPLRPANQYGPLAESLEVTVLWGANVLAVEQLTPPRPYAVGEVGGSGGAGTSAAGDVDFALSSERLGSERREIVALRSGVPYAIFSAMDAPLVLESGEAVDASSITVDCSDVALGARGIELRRDRTVVVETSGVTFRLAGLERPERIPRAVLGNTDRSALAAMSTAALLQGVLVASLAYFTPDLAWGADDGLDRERLILMQQYLHAEAERNREEQAQSVDESGGDVGAPAAGSPGTEGKSGSAHAPQRQRRAGIAGDQPERVVGRSELLAEATSFGTIGLLNALNSSNAPSSPWGANLALGPDAANAMGDLWGDELGDVAGTGLGVSGTERGAGGPGLGIGVGQIGTCMGIDCYGNGRDGFGRSAALTKRGHVTKGPRIATRPPELSGRLPPDVIQRIVRQNFGRFRQCYEVGLQANPNLEGRVTARFVIGRDGSVSNVSMAGTDLPDAKVASCVASSFYGLSFPAPEAGIVTVSYPILLTPG